MLSINTNISSLIAQNSMKTSRVEFSLPCVSAKTSYPLPRVRGQQLLLVMLSQIGINRFRVEARNDELGSTRRESLEVNYA